MTDRIKAPGWFWLVGTLLVLWNITGVLSFFIHVLITEDQLLEMTTAEQDLMTQYPSWTYVVFGIAVFAGLLGSLGLVLRQRWARVLLSVSLIAVVIQMSHNLFLTDSMAVYGSNALVFPVIVIVLGFYQVWLSGNAIKKQWIV